MIVFRAVETRSISSPDLDEVVCGMQREGTPGHKRPWKRTRFMTGILVRLRTSEFSL